MSIEEKLTNFQYLVHHIIHIIYLDSQATQYFYDSERIVKLFSRFQEHPNSYIVYIVNDFFQFPYNIWKVHKIESYMQYYNFVKFDKHHIYMIGKIIGRHSVAVSEISEGRHSVTVSEIS